MSVLVEIGAEPIIMKKLEDIKLGKIPLIYIVFPPLGIIMLLKYLINQLNKKKDK